MACLFPNVIVDITVMHHMFSYLSLQVCFDSHIGKIFVNSFTCTLLNSATFIVGGIDRFLHGFIAVGSPTP